MRRALALATTLAVGVAYAEPPADAPVVLRVLDGTVRTPDGEVRVGPGSYLNEVAAVNVVRACTRAEAEAAECKAQLEQAPQTPAGGLPIPLVASLIAGAFVAGVAAGKLLR